MTLALRRFLVQPVAAIVVDGVDVGEEVGEPFQVWTVDQFVELIAVCHASIEKRNAEADVAAEVEEEPS